MAHKAGRPTLQGRLHIHRVLDWKKVTVRYYLGGKKRKEGKQEKAKTILYM